MHACFFNIIYIVLTNIALFTNYSLLVFNPSTLKLEEKLSFFPVYIQDYATKKFRFLKATLHWEIFAASCNAISNTGPCYQKSSHILKLWAWSTLPTFSLHKALLKDEKWKKWNKKCRYTKPCMAMLTISCH